MDIINPNPITIPAKEYNQTFILQLVITAEPKKAWNAGIVSVPFDGDESILNNEKFVASLKDLKALSQLDADLAQAMSIILPVIAKYSVKCKQKNIKIVTTQNVQQVLE